MTRKRLAVRSLLAVTMIIAGATLAGCGTLPMSGSVQAGRAVGAAEDLPDFSYVPDGPAVGASPEDIVAGFVAAGSGAGTRGRWEIARTFLAPSFSEKWQPQAGVIVYNAGDREVTSTGKDTVQMRVTPVATIDATGVYSPAGKGNIELPFTLAKQPDGQWRITSAPNGIVLERSRFDSVFRSYTLNYFDPTYTYLVPDVRWFPTTNSATYIAEALINGGPSPWLASAVVSAFPKSTTLAQQAVPVVGGTAQVSLTRAALGADPLALGRMQKQLDASLSSASIGQAQMLVDDQPLAARAVNVRETLVDARAVVLRDGKFGFLSADTLEPIAGLSTAVAGAHPIDVQTNANLTLAAIQDKAGHVLRATGENTLVTLDERRGLVAPTVDSHDLVWTGQRDKPGALVAYGPGQTKYTIATKWTGVNGISAISISRDGTRLAAVVTEGSRSALIVAGINRDEKGMPVSLGDRLPLATFPGTGVSLAWLDGSTLGVAIRSGDQDTLLEQPVGGFETTYTARPGVATVAGTNQASTARLLDARGELYDQRGATWQQLASGIDVLATQQGSPH